MTISQLPLLKIPPIVDSFSRESSIILHLGDSLEFLQTIPDGLAKLIITSPPYNIGKEYETKDEIGLYLQKQETVIKHLVRILHDEGSIC